MSHATEVPLQVNCNVPQLNSCGNLGISIFTTYYYQRVGLNDGDDKAKLQLISIDLV